MDQIGFPLASFNKSLRYGFPITVGSCPIEVRAALSRYTYLFIVYIIQIANKHRIDTGKANITPYHLLWALNWAGFTDFIPSSRIYLDFTRTRNSDRRKQSRANCKNGKNYDDDEDGDENTTNAPITQPAKRGRRSTVANKD